MTHRPIQVLVVIAGVGLATLLLILNPLSAVASRWSNRPGLDDSLAYKLAHGAMRLQWTDMPTAAIACVPDHYKLCDMFVIGELVGLRHVTYTSPHRPLGTWYSGGIWQMDVAMTEPGYFSPRYRELYRGRRAITPYSLISPDDSVRVTSLVVAVADFNREDGELWGNVMPYNPK